MHRAYVCLKCGNPVMRGSHCACFRTKRTIVGAQKPQTADRTAATPPFLPFLDWLMHWKMRSRRRAIVAPRCVASSFESEPAFRLGDLTRSGTMMDCFYAYVVVPCFAVLTVLSTIYIVVSVLDLFLWELLEIMSFPIL